MNGLLIFTFYISVLQELAENIPKFITMIGNINCMEDILGPKLEDNEIIDKGIMPPINGNISFQNINFSYIKDKMILDNFNMNIKMGERVAIIAPSGNGKTTIMKLLLKFYKPQQGMILLDNININDINTKHLRKTVNYINQKTILFNDTIINNMKYGNEKSDTEIYNLLQYYDLLSLFNNNINELQKIVEINGTNISMGLQKIIFLVRGILKTDCSIYIFDEPLTSLDMNTRKKVMRMINEIVSDKTTIIITHDIEIKQIVNRIINLNTKN
jgi:ATP-binding cassette subfamily B protein